MESKSKVVAAKVSRQKLIENSRANFYANLNQVYLDNKDAPVLESAPETKPKPAVKRAPPKNPPTTNYRDHL